MENLRLIDVLEALTKRNRRDEAEDYLTFFVLNVGLIHGFTIEEVEQMTISELEHWVYAPPKPLKYDGWNFWWGEHINANRD
jgi:hypothetical protein